MKLRILIRLLQVQVGVGNAHALTPESGYRLRHSTVPAGGASVVGRAFFH